MPDGPARKTTITDVLYIPEVPLNILGVIRLSEKGYGVNFLRKEVTITRLKDGAVIGYGDVIGTAYYLRVKEVFRIPCV